MATTKPLSLSYEIQHFANTYLEKLPSFKVMLVPFWSSEPFTGLEVETPSGAWHRFKSGLRKNGSITHSGKHVFLKFSYTTWSLHSSNDRRYSYFTRNIYNRCIGSFKILFGVTWERCPAINMETRL